MNLVRKIFLHAIIWIALIVFMMFVGNHGQGIGYRTVVNFLYFGILNIAIFYINYLFILPQFLKKRRYWATAISIVALVALFGFIKVGLALYFKDVIWKGEIQMNPEAYLHRYYLSTLFVSGFFVFISTAVNFIGDWFVTEKERRTLANEKLSAELAALRSQINPHFLFNCLNNIYSLSYQKSDKTPEAILKLSEIMRYMLYESNDGSVELSREISYLENFIELQKLRFKENTVNFKVTGEIRDQKIAPLILISFIENAFKHGIANDPEYPIRISIEICEGALKFNVVNREGKQNKDETGGIGLINVKRRLDLLYPEKYDLNISTIDGVYTAELSLIL